MCLHVLSLFRKQLILFRSIIVEILFIDVYRKMKGFYYLLTVERPGIRDPIIIQKLNERIQCALKMELGKNHPENDQLRTELQKKLPILQLLNYRHTDLLTKFKEDHPNIEFPALHKELFSQDGLDEQM